MFFSVMVYYRILNVPVLYCRTMLFICLVYDSLHLLIPNFLSISPPSPPFGKPESVLCVRESVSVSQISSFVP